MTAPLDSTHTLLRQAWSALGGDQKLPDLVETVGDMQGLLPSVLPALPAMTAAVSASTLAASVLDAARQGRPASRVSVEVGHVAVAARSERYAYEDGSPGSSDLFAPLSRFWRTADGWLRLHTNYPWHRDRALQVLGSDHRPESVAAAIRSWRGDDLEDALAAGGALGYAVRTRDEWRAHPQGLAVATLPLVELVAGSSTGRPTGPGRAAEGFRVLDLTRVIAGPVATRTLAAWGADVLRLDSPHLPELPRGTLDTLQGKRSALLDFATRAGRRRLEELLAEADLLVQGYRPGALERYGLTAPGLAERHPHLTTVTLSAWSRTGPWAQRRGFDSLVQCSTGIAAAQGTDGQPGVLPAQVLDHATGYLAAAAALLSLAGIHRGEPPRAVELSLAQTARWLMGGGDQDREGEREANPDRYSVSLPRAAHLVHVIGPPGRLTDLTPAWRRTTEFGADPPAFSNPRS